MKAALVTGASSGIGREFIRQIKEKEPSIEKIYAIARRKDRLEELCAQYGDQIIPISCDLANEASFPLLSERLQSDGAHLDIVVAAAGFGKYGSFANNTEEDMEAEVKVNIVGLMRTVRTALPFLSSGSRILLMGSQSAFQPLPEFNIYASTKAFVLHFGRALHRELRSQRITVTTICPGYVDTEFFQVAAQSGDPTACRNFKPLYPANDVVAQALADSKKGKDLSVHGFQVQLSRLASKLLPHSLVMKVWLKIR
jgi:hypothetical protein